MTLTWYQKRKITTIIGIGFRCTYSFEYASNAISAIYYYRNSFQTDNPKFYYGCSMAAIFASAVISSRLCGWLMDKTRNLRRIVLTLVLFNIVGNLLYTLTWSPWLPVLGRLVCGVGAGIGTVVSGKEILMKS